VTFKTFKIEFVYPNYFESLKKLKLELYDYVNWFDNIRLHSPYYFLVTYKDQIGYKYIYEYSVDSVLFLKMMNLLN
jgi:hypothetical protein